MVFNGYYFSKTWCEGLVASYFTRFKIKLNFGSSIKAGQSLLTVGELEVYPHHMKDLSIIYARKPDTSDGVTIPGSKNIPYDELIGRIGQK
ncbi:hypothetical protein LY58_02833 [Salegentibacter salegens]|nr:hypothetical protein LY58_02833 [Salegentibacter salegens]